MDPAILARWLQREGDILLLPDAEPGGDSDDESRAPFPAWALRYALQCHVPAGGRLTPDPRDEPGLQPS